ncbi:MAG TPA: hypothetical protein VM434_19410 [Beijerinckiaceae bacterium]|nr:hypothetical protein [Beijerinckiaceae bacterium]
MSQSAGGPGPLAIELARERAHLVMAERDIAAGEARVRAQAALIATLRDRGQDTMGAARLLETLEETLAQWRCHRDLIAARIAYLEGRA